MADPHQVEPDPIQLVTAVEAVAGGHHGLFPDLPEHVLAAARQAGMVEQGVGPATGLVTGGTGVLPAAGEHQLLKIPQLLLAGEGRLLLSSQGR